MLGRRMAGVCAIAVGMIGGMAGQRKQLPPACPPGATCREVANPVEAVCSPVPKGKDELIHYTVFFNTKDASQVAAFILAMDMWNCFSSVTGIKFERTQNKKKAHLQFQRGKESSNPTNRACAVYEPGGSFIWYSEPLMRWAGSSPNMAARVYAHELGHAVALCHLSRKAEPSSVMHEGPEKETDCQKVAEKELTDVQRTDAEFVKVCAQRVREDCDKERLKNLKNTKNK